MEILSLGLHSKDIKCSKPISHELLEEWLLELAVKNQKRITSCKNLEYLWSSDVAEFVFNVCEKYNMKKNVKYLALEIYERFIAEHVIETRQKHLEIINSEKPSSWENIEQRLEQQSVLRVLTSIQLASKLESHYDHILPMQVSRMLDKCGKPFSLNGLFSSELRVMKTLEYKLNIITPAIYLEMLLYILFVNDPTIEDGLYESATTILDFVYLHRKKIYDELYTAITGDKNERNKETNLVFLKVKSDYMLLATSIIAAASYIYANKKYAIILEQLHQITRLMKKDIGNFSAVIAFYISNILSK